jgi:uncharacterized protein YpmS
MENYEVITSYYHDLEKKDYIYKILIDNETLTYTSNSNQIKILSFPDLKFMGYLKGHTDEVTNIKFLNTNTLASLCKYCT